MDNNDAQPRKITSLVQHLKEQPKTVTLEVKYQEDLIALDIEILNHAEWMALDHEVPYPDRVKTGMSPNGPVFDYNDPTYQQKLSARRTKVTLKRVARCIQAEIEGDTNDDQADWLFRNYPIGFLNAIAIQINDLHAEGEASVQTRRDTFHNGRPAPVAGDAGVADDA